MVATLSINGSNPIDRSISRSDVNSLKNCRMVPFLERMVQASPMEPTPPDVQFPANFAENYHLVNRGSKFLHVVLPPYHRQSSGTAGFRLHV